jgi:hypothetical protein
MSSVRYSNQTLKKIEISRHTFEKYSIIKYNENPSSDSREIPWGWTDGRIGRQTDNVTKLIAAFRNFVNETKNEKSFIANS